MSTPPIDTQQAAGFLNSLFDFSFTNFVATRLIKVLYVLAIIGAAFCALAMVVSSFTASIVQGIVVLLIVAPLAFFFMVIYARVMMELLIVLFRMSEHLAEIAQQGRR